jgi:hypothetical protein
LIRTGFLGPINPEAQLVCVRSFFSWEVFLDEQRVYLGESAFRIYKDAFGWQSPESPSRFLLK